jgi:hypothetical protein
MVAASDQAKSDICPMDLLTNKKSAHITSFEFISTDIRSLQSCFLRFIVVPVLNPKPYPLLRHFRPFVKLPKLLLAVLWLVCL